MNKKTFQVPFQEHTGNHRSYAYYHCKLVDNYEFEDILKYKTHERGRSALNIVWEGSDGKTYRSGMSLLEDVCSGNLPFLKVDNRLAIQGTFTFKKQGTSVLLILKK